MESHGLRIQSSAIDKDPPKPDSAVDMVDSGHSRRSLSRSASKKQQPARPAPAAEQRSPPLATHLQNLPPINTDPARRSSSKRMSAKIKRVSTFSNASSHGSLPIRSRPQSLIFPAFHSSLPYAFVRDFAYPASHPLHYGPPPDSPSAATTPASEFHRRLSDPPPTSWSGAKGQWSAGPDKEDASFFGGPQLPSTAYSAADGPPWKEDDDLHSPVVTSSKHKKTRSNYVDFDFSRKSGSTAAASQRASFAGVDRHLYLYDHAGEQYAPADYRVLARDDDPWRRDRFTAEPHEGMSSPDEYDEDDDDERGDSRYSRDYSFTIASPDEEVHGKAVALFDFERENDNELPLSEGQILWVSYRHEQGWLVAQDPRSGESGLVPEEYVRLVRDIEGGLTSLNGLSSAFLDEDALDVETPTAITRRPSLHERTTSSNSTSSTQEQQKQPYPSVVSHFSTSSKDLHPYPQPLRDHSQNSTPTTTTAGDASLHGDRPPRGGAADAADRPAAGGGVSLEGS